jgi:ubiquinone/menaquinone biosynthesis C-methylase UbiE
MNTTITKEQVEKMSYVQLLAKIKEVNRPPGGKRSIMRVVKDTHIQKDSLVLDVGCNTGYSTFEIAHLVKCKITGLDISPEMIATANTERELDSHKNLIEFIIGDGMNLPFNEETFDVVMSGGSTAFIPDKKKALEEYARVTKTWGFVADINFFYHTQPPANILMEMNELMNINIEPWELEYWLDIYSNTRLEIYNVHQDTVYVPSNAEIKKYCETIANDTDATPDAKEVLLNRLTTIMTLFAENHKYLSYGVFILRKRKEPEQVSLFGA